MTASKETTEISAAKVAAGLGELIIGSYPMGKVINMNGKVYTLKHPHYRFTQNPNNPWGHPDGGYTQSDLVPVGMNLEISTQEQTAAATHEWLTQLVEGVIPEGMTQGVELEGAVYDGNSTHLAPAYVNPKNNMHPELSSFTLETATGKQNDSTYPHSPVSIAQQIGAAIMEGQVQAASEGNRVVYASVPEGGVEGEFTITQVPYLQAFAPKVLEDTVKHIDTVPKEVLALYSQIGITDIASYLKETNILNWPVNALHVHNGVPMIGEYADTRSAFAMAQIRNTEMAKILSFMMYNTKYCYGVDTGLKDVRSIMRRLLSTAHGGDLPQSADQYVHEAVGALEKGSIHSTARYPDHSQHDRTRIRMDGVTMESIDAPMSPDLRHVLGWTYINQIMNVIALDALENANGDESQVLGILQSQWGELMNPISALGNERSSFSHDIIFNSAGFGDKADWMQKDYSSYVGDIISIFDTYGERYPAIKMYITIVKKLLTDVIEPANPSSTSLEEYFGIEKGVYEANGKNRGLVVDAKSNRHPEELITIQSKATQLQAEALLKIHNDEDLLLFFGLQ